VAVRARQSNRITDGYGLPRAAIGQIARSATKLVLLVDCGTNQAEDVRTLAGHGIDTVIVDHHIPLGEPARACALVNPYVGTGAGRGLCSAGLAFKLVQALTEPGSREQLAGALDLAALGTLADCSPLIGESRILVTLGLPRIVNSRRPGLRRLCQAAGLSSPEPEAVIRKLVPKLNASGRLGDASAVWHLLRDAPSGYLDELVATVEEAHDTTRGLHRELFAEAQAQVSRVHFRDQHILIVSRPGWPQGLMGPLASQLAQRYGRPAIALAMSGEQGTGSGRSPDMFNLFEALRECQDLLVRFGGHAQACGLTIAQHHLERFRALVNERARRSISDGKSLGSPRIVDMEARLNDLRPAWLSEWDRLAPFGQGNPRPTVLLRRLALRRRSARTGTASDGRLEIAVRGRVPDEDGWYDVVASPAVVAGELVLTLGDATAAAAPGEPGPTSGTTYRRARA
jgi:single-stranded-DNA-specific exonuclease